MEKRIFQRNKYGSELLIDATTVAEMEIQSPTQVLNFYLIMFLRRSSGIFWKQDQQVALGDRMVLFVEPGRVSEISEAHFEEGFLLFFEGDFLDEFFHASEFIHQFGVFHRPGHPFSLFLGQTDYDRLEGVVEEIKAEIDTLSNDSRHLLRSLLYYLLIRLNRLYGQAHGHNVHLLKDPLARRFLALLEANFSHKREVQQVAEELQVSRSTLNQVCKRHFGKSPQQLIRERLLLTAKREIQYSDKDIAEIAYELQFSAPAHFSRFFKQMMGESPHAYRERWTNR